VLGALPALRVQAAHAAFVPPATVTFFEHAGFRGREFDADAGFVYARQYGR
jgi:hypothetical protein